MMRQERTYSIQSGYNKMKYSMNSALSINFNKYKYSSKGSEISRNSLSPIDMENFAKMQFGNIQDDDYVYIV